MYLSARERCWTCQARTWPQDHQGRANVPAAYQLELGCRLQPCIRQLLEHQRQRKENIEHVFQQNLSRHIRRYLSTNGYPSSHFILQANTQRRSNDALGHRIQPNDSVRLHAYLRHIMAHPFADSTRLPSSRGQRIRSNPGAPKHRA